MDSGALAQLGLEAQGNVMQVTCTCQMEMSDGSTA